MKDILTAHALTAGYQRRGADVVVVGPEDLALRRGELVALLGPNGAGKSTLLRTLAGVQTPLSGSVRLGGDDVHHLPARERARRLGLVLTERLVVGSLPVEALVALGRYAYTGLFGRMKGDDAERVAWALQSVGMADFRARPVGELSDGERQKVMIARALAQDPALLLLDEPTAHLDLPGRIEVMRLLRELAHESGRAVLLTTHELDLALRTADRVWLLPKAGRIDDAVPEAVALGGALERTFATAAPWFDPATGAFTLTTASRGPVALDGPDAPARFWTRRALERLGYQIRDDAPTRIVVDAGAWRLVEDGRHTSFDALGALLDRLRD